MTTPSASRTIDGKPIFWRDPDGVVHACETVKVDPATRLVWTLCERDVPPNGAHLPLPWDVMTCPKCIEADPKGTGRQMVGCE